MLSKTPINVKLKFSSNIFSVYAVDHEIKMIQCFYKVLQVHKFCGNQKESNKYTSGIKGLVSSQKHQFNDPLWQTPGRR